VPVLARLQAKRLRGRWTGRADNRPAQRAQEARLTCVLTTGVAICGKCDTGLAQGNRLIPAEMDQANGLPEDPLKPAQGQGSSSPETTTAHSHDLTP